MSRTIATVKRPDPHDFEPDPALAGGRYCRCGLIKTNSVHAPAVIADHRDRLARVAASQAAAQEQHRARTGDR